MKTYIVIDTQGPLLADIPTFEAKNSRDALQQYLDSKGWGQIKFKRRGDNFVRWAVQQTVVIDGVKYRRGNKVWYGESYE